MVAEYRPISVSTVYAPMHESLFLKKTKLHNCSQKNQIGYKNITACKNAYFVVNDTMNYYINGISNMHLVSLDATKAFDKLWRSGLFHKLINKIDPTLWRVIYSYYKESKIIVQINNKLSEV